MKIIVENTPTGLDDAMAIFKKQALETRRLKRKKEYYLRPGIQKRLKREEARRKMHKRKAKDHSRYIDYVTSRNKYFAELREKNNSEE